MTDAIRTPEAAFAGLPDFDLDFAYREVDGLRLAHVDVGSGPPVVFWHGEPTWSFLWRKVIPPVRDAGFRCLAPDLPGFGRSDKPTDRGWYTYDRFTEHALRFLEDLDVTGATLVVHDWGGPVGLRAAVEASDRVARLVVLDTGLFTGHQRMSQAWEAFRGFVEATEDLPIGMLVNGGAASELPPEVVAGYEAPFPEPAAKAGARAFPLLIPLTPDAPGAEAGQRTLAALGESPWPKLVLWADSDPILPVKTGEAFAAAIGAGPPEIVESAGHFLQEDAGERIGTRIAEWLVTPASP